MKITDIRRISKEDYSEEEQPLIEKLATSLNPLLDKLATVFNKNIDFDNLNQEVITFEVEVGSTGKPKAVTELKTSLRTRCRGLTVIRAENLVLDGTTPTATPFVTFGLNGSAIVINNVTGIPADKRYRLTVISYG